MWLRSIELRNVKSYGDAHKIEFSTGINAICGPNGAGKSTILEAIGFALFDAQMFGNQNQFLREGTSRGEIVVTIVDALDEREYQLVRPIGSGGPSVYDPEIQRTVVDRKADVLDWLKEHLGVEPTVDLSTLFQDAVGVPQGMLTASFLETNTRQRKGKFDPLLQVSDYETAWDKLRRTLTYVGDLIAEQKVTIEGLRGRLTRLPNLEEKEKALCDAINAASNALERVTAELGKARAEKERLDALKEQINRLEKQCTGLQEQLSGITRRLAEAQESVREAESATGVVEAATAGHQAYKDTQECLEELEAQTQARNALQAELNAAKGNLALISQTLERLQEQLADINAAETELEDIAPGVAQQEKLEAELQQANLAEQRLQQLRGQKTEQERRLGKLQSALSDVEEGLERRRQLEREASAIQEKLQRGREETDGLNGMLESTEKALSEVESELGHAVQDEWQWKEENRTLAEELARLEELRTAFSTVQAQIGHREEITAALAIVSGQREENEQELSSLQSREAVIRAHLQALTERLSVLDHADEATCPVCEQPMGEERAAELVDHYQTEQNQLTTQLNELQQIQSATRTAFDGLKEHIEDYNQQLAALPSTKRAEELQEEIADQEELLNRVQARVDALQEAPEQAQALRAKQEGLREERRATRDKLQALTDRREELSDQLAKIQAQQTELPSADRKEELVEDLGEQQGVINRLEEQIADLSDIPEQIEALNAALSELDNPRAKQIALTATIEKRASVEGELSSALDEQGNLSQEARRLEDKLQTYEGLDQAIAEQKAIRSSSEADHQRYQANLQIAQALPARLEKAEQLVCEKERVSEEHKRIVENLESRKADYSEDRHREADEEHRTLLAREAELSERLRGQQKELKSIAGELTELRVVQQKLVEAEKEENSLKELKEVTHFLRERIREAGPVITRRLVQLISHEANRVFSDIMADHIMQLDWSEDYTITVEYQGEKREFRQLSGGEQMAAALAVRLALLREMSEIRIAFFDEPTAHLDEQRRENLAEQIANIQGFNQLFVISHDDTFERDTHHVLRVRKENGLSRVEVG